MKALRIFIRSEPFNRQYSTNFLGVFDHFVRLALKGLMETNVAKVIIKLVVIKW